MARLTFRMSVEEAALTGGGYSMKNEREIKRSRCQSMFEKQHKELQGYFLTYSGVDGLGNGG